MSIEEVIAPSITFMNSTGDITITWEKDKEQDVMDLVQKKIDQGFTFFTLKRGLFGTKKVAVENIETIRKAGSVVAPDALANDILMKLGDNDVAAVVSSGSASIASTVKKASIETAQRAKSALEVVGSQSIAIRPIAGG